MEPTPEQIGAVARWLSQQYGPDFSVEAHILSTPEVVLFRVHELKPHSPRYETEISFEAFDDFEVADILADFTTYQLIEKLRRRPGVRLLYDRFRRIRPTDRHSG